jgi:hypothetical protein
VILFLISLPNFAFAAEMSVVISNVLDDAISQIQTMVNSMREGCSGGARGLPPVNWGGLQKKGDEALLALREVQSAVTSTPPRTDDAIKQLRNAEGALDELVNGVHNMCSGERVGWIPYIMANIKLLVLR